MTADKPEEDVQKATSSTTVLLDAKLEDAEKDWFCYREQLRREEITVSIKTIMRIVGI